MRNIIKKIIFSCLICVLFVVSGCGKEGNVKREKKDYNTTLNEALNNRASLPDICKVSKQDLTSLDISMDVSNADLKLPQNMDNLPVLFCDWGDVSKDSLEARFTESVKLFTDNRYDTGDMNYYLRDKETLEYTKEPMASSSEDIVDAASYLAFNDGTYSALLYKSTYMLELSNERYFADITDCPIDYDWGNRGICIGALVKSYRLNGDEIITDSYMLDGGEVSISDAVNCVEEYFSQELPFVASKYLNYKVYKVSVYTATENTYYYEFAIAAYYEDMELNSRTGIYEMPNGEEYVDHDLFATDHTASMFKPDSVDYIWSCCHNYENVTEHTTEERFITPEYACLLVDSILSDESAFVISDIALVYETDFCEHSQDTENSRPYGVKCHPVYRFIVDNPGLAGYNKLYFIVDAIDGEVKISYE